MNPTQNRFLHTAQALVVATAVLAGASALAATGAATAQSQAKPARAGCAYGLALEGNLHDQGRP